MVKKLQKEFISYCNNQELEVNSNQIEIVHRLEKYYQENFKTYFLNKNFRMLFFFDSRN